MNKPTTALFLLAPSLFLGGFALWIARQRSPAKPAQSAQHGPFVVKIAGVEQRKVGPLQVFQGYDRQFEMVFRTSGDKPAWWSNFNGSKSGKEIKNWKFFLEREGRITPFSPSKTQLWTSAWDKERERYTNEFLLHCGEVPAQSALKARGTSAISDSSKNLSVGVPFEITLKRAGETWARPVVSTDPGAVVRRIEVVRQNGQRLAKIQVFVISPKDQGQITWQDGGDFLDGNWRDFHHIETGNNAWKGYRSVIPHSIRGGIPVGQSQRLREYEFQWGESTMKAEPRRDVIAIMHISIDERWPLEIAFQAKKEGQQSLGVVPALTRP